MISGYFEDGMPWGASNFIGIYGQQASRISSPSANMNETSEELTFEEERLLAFLKEADLTLSVDSLQAKTPGVSNSTPTLQEFDIPASHTDVTDCDTDLNSLVDNSGNSNVALYSDSSFAKELGSPEKDAGNEDPAINKEGKSPFSMSV